MTDELIRLLLDDAPDAPARREAWIRSVAPEGAEALSRWEAFETALGARVARAIPDRELMVLLAIEESGRPDMLDENERARLDAARPGIAAARESVPAFDTVIRSISADCDEFDAAWNERFESSPVPVTARRPTSDRPPVRGARVRRLAVRWLTAAVVVVFVASALMLTRRGPVPQTVTAGESTLVETLADGSVVRLHPGSTLTLESPRRVRLDGRAFFDVPHDKSGFVVETRHANVTVLGTSFAVTADLDATEIVLVSGQVSATPTDRPEDPVLLEPGDRMLVRPGSPPGAPVPVDVERTLEWTGLLIFRATPMSRVVDRLERVYGERIALDPALSSEPVTGTFSPEMPVDRVAAILAETLGARLTPDGNGGWHLRL